MDIRILRYFLTVVREESISGAAEALFITQPTLSRQLQELEKELGTKLLIRGKNGITLTDSGMLLRRRAEELVDLADKTEQELKAGEAVSGTISIGCGESLAERQLSGMITDFSAEYPEVRFELYTGSADHIREQVENGLLDLGLLLEPVDIDKYEYVRLSQTDRWGILLRFDDPLAMKPCVTVEDIKDRAFILPRRRGAKSVVRSWFGGEFEKLHIFAEGTLLPNSARLVLLGDGIAVTIEGAADLFDPSRLCFRPFSPELVNTSVLIWKKYQPFGQAAARFIEYVRDALKA